MPAAMIGASFAWRAVVPAGPWATAVVTCKACSNILSDGDKLLNSPKNAIPLPVRIGETQLAWTGRIFGADM